MASSLNDLKLTIGVPEVALIMTAEEGKLQGSMAETMMFWFEKGLGANVTYVDSNFIGTDLGECDATGFCTGHLGQLWRYGQDMELLREPFAVTKWVLRPPVIYSPPAISWITRIISISPEPSSVQRNGDVIDSFSKSSLTATLVWLAIIYFILIAFRNVHQIFDSKNYNIRWAIFRAACFQCDFLFRELSLRLLAICVLIGLFITKAHYDGSFKTDLTIKEELDYINSVSDLLAARRWPAFMRGDTAGNYFETSRDEEDRKLFANAKLRDDKGFPSFVNITLEVMLGLITAIRGRKAVMLTQYGGEQMIRAIDCHKQVNAEVIEGQQLYSSSKGYNDEINAFIYNPNISLTLKSRLDVRIMRLFEMRIFYKDGVTDFQGTLAKKLMVDGNLNYWQCVNPKLDDKDHEVFPLRIINVTKLMTLIAKCFLFACSILLLEVMKRSLKKREESNRISMWRRQNARRRLELMRFQSRQKVSLKTALQLLDP